MVLNFCSVAVEILLLMLSLLFLKFWIDFSTAFLVIQYFSDHTFKYVIDTALKTAGVRIGYFGHYSIYHNEKQLKSRKTLRDYNLLHGGQVFEIMAIDEEEDRGHPPSNGLIKWIFIQGHSMLPSMLHSRAPPCSDLLWVL